MLLDLLFPKTCFVCGAFGSYVCIPCAQKLEVIKRDICPYCKRMSLYGKTHERCKISNGIDGLISVYKYRGVFAKIIKGVKYAGVRSALGNIFNTFPLSRRRDMMILFTEQVSGQKNTCLPIPLHRDRLMQRGFNQAEIVARYVAQYTNTTVDKNLLLRLKVTPQQARLANKNDRYENIKHAFSVANDHPTYQHVILVDDVWTTGATIKEAAHMLKVSGCKTVYAFTLAR